MAAFQKETGSVTSRDFSASGWCGKFKAWVVKTYGNGGPQWFIIDDQSALVTNPYLVVSDQSSPTWDSRAKFIQITMLTASETIQVDYFLWWNTSTHTGFGNWHRGSLTTLTGSFIYDFRGGPDMLFLASRLGTNIYWSFLDTWDPITALCESTSIFGTLANRAYYEQGDTNNQLSGYHLITGFAANLDAAGKLYFSANFSSGNLTVNIYKDSARTQLIGHTSSSNTTGAKAITADNASGLGGTINYDAIGSSSNTGISCRYLRLDLQSGQGAAFTPGKPYFIYERAEGVSRYGYFNVASVVGDQLIISSLDAVDFAATAIIAPYLFPLQAYSSNFTGAVASIPLVSIQSLVTNTVPNNPGIGYGWQSSGFTSLSAPDDENRYGVMRPLIYEGTINQGTNSNLNRAYGRPRNIYMTSSNGIAVFQDGRLINGNQYLYFNSPQAGTAMLVRDWTSLS